MAITATIAEIAAAIRVGDSSEETAEVSRLRDYSIIAVSQHLGPAYDDAPVPVVNMAATLLAGWLYDKPTTTGGFSFANAIKFSGAIRVLFPYKAHSVGLIGGNGVAVAQKEEVGIMGIDTEAVQALIDAHAAMSDIHHRPASRVGVVNVAAGRLPSTTGKVMRIGWSNTQDYAEEIFTRDGNHPDDGAAVGTIAGVFPPVQPAGIPAIPDVAANEKYLHIWIGEIPGNIAQLTFFGAPAHGVSEAAAQTYNTTDGTWWVTNLPLSAGISAYAFSAVVVGLLIATQKWVEGEIANIMLSGGGITTAQAQTLIDAAVVNFQTDSQVATIVADALNALPDWQTLTEVNTLISNAIAALTLGQTAAQVAALIALHAAIASAHHVKTPEGGGGGGQPVMLGTATAVGTPIFLALTPVEAAAVIAAYNAGTYPGGYYMTLVWDVGSITHGVESTLPADLFGTLADGRNYYFHIDASAALDATTSRYLNLGRVPNPDTVEITTLPTSDDFDAGTVFTLWGLP